MTYSPNSLKEDLRRGFYRGVLQGLLRGILGVSDHSSYPLKIFNKTRSVLLGRGAGFRFPALRIMLSGLRGLRFPGLGLGV